MSTEKQDAEQAAFEDWLEFSRPSGDHEAVQRQWHESSDYRELHAAPDQTVECSACYGAGRVDERNLVHVRAHEKGPGYELLSVHCEACGGSGAVAAARFSNVSCSQCGNDFGPGNEGFSRCADHKNFRRGMP